MSNNNALTPKTQLTQYVDDAVKIESAVMTVKKAIEACEEEKDRLTTEQQEAIINKDKCLEKKIIEHEKAQFHPYPQFPDEPSFFPTIITTGVLWAIGSLILLVITDNSLFSELAFSSFIIAWPLGSIIFLFRKILYNRSRNNFLKEYNEIDQQNAEIKKQFLPALEKEYKEEVHKINHEFLKKIDVIEAQESELNKQIAELNTIRTKFYALNVIPPNYRTLDCAIVLNQIFTNDLADTMREAILLYDEKVYRGIVLRDIHTILETVNNLSTDMQLVVSKIESINRNVRMMSEDLYTISTSIGQIEKDNQKATEELIHQSQATRYATEQIAESNRLLEQHTSNLVFYEQMKKQ